MSFFSIPPTGASPYTAAATATNRAPSVSPASQSYAATAAEANADVTVDTIPASPPAEVLDQMRSAAGATDRLAAAGKALHFDLDETTGRLAVQVTDLSGSVLGTASASSVLDVASGQDL